MSLHTATYSMLFLAFMLGCLVGELLLSLLFWLLVGYAMIWLTATAIETVVPVVQALWTDVTSWFGAPSQNSIVIL